MRKINNVIVSNVNSIEDFFFNVAEESIYRNNKGSYTDIKDYKGIYREDNNKLISVVSNNYKLIPNKDIILPLLDDLSNLDSKWILDKSHSFVNNKRMRLQLTFPDLLIDDNESKSSLSLFIHNSYDMSEGVRLFWGGIRQICTNGMVFMKISEKFYSKHSKNVEIINMHEKIKKTYDEIPSIQRRIQILNDISANESKLINNIEKEYGKGISKYVDDEVQGKQLSMWQLYNIITYYISHYVALEQKAKYQIKTSRLFEL